MTPLLPSLSLVIPVYNELPSLDPLLVQLRRVQGVIAAAVEVVFVDDGSRDGSTEWLHQAAREHSEITPVYHPQNLGIGQAIRSGYAAASREWIALIPADLQFQPGDLRYALPYCAEADVVCLYRSRRPDYSWFRSLVSQGNRYLNRILFDLSGRDVNWVKLYRRWVIKEIPVRSTTPFVESERLILAMRRGARIVEVEAPYHPRQSGRPQGARLTTVLRSFGDLVRFVIRREMR